MSPAKALKIARATAILSAALLACAYRRPSVQAEIGRADGESDSLLAKRVIPPGTDLAYPPIEIAAGPSEKDLVILFRKSGSVSNYSGWVLVPSEGHSGAYLKVILPAMEEAEGLFDITIKSVFAIKAGNGKSGGFVVLYEYYRAGSGADPAYASTIYKWAGSSLAVDSAARARLVGLKDEGQIRAKLEP